MCDESHMNVHSLAMFYISFSSRNAAVLKLIFREKKYLFIQKGIKRNKKGFSKM